MRLTLVVVCVVVALLASAYALDLNLARRHRYEGGSKTKSVSSSSQRDGGKGALSTVMTSQSSAEGSKDPKRSSKSEKTDAADKDDDKDEVDANDNSKEDNKGAPSDEEFEKLALKGDKPLKIIASSATDVPNDPVRPALAKFKGAVNTVRAVIHLSRSQFEKLNKSAESRAAVNSDMRALLSKVAAARAAGKGTDGAFLLTEEELSARNETGVDAAPAAPAAPTISCFWSESQTKTPDAQTREPAAGGLTQEGRYVWYSTERGEGAWTAVVNQRRCKKKIFAAKQYCRCRRSSKDANSKRGQMDVNVQVVCVETIGTQKRFVPPPATCRTTLRVQVSYQGVATVKTDGGTCFPFSPSMDASSTNEVLAKINDQDAFVKAGSVQTGNKVTSTISYQFNVKGGVTTTGASGDATISFGYSEQIQKNYGEKSVDVVGFATKDITAANNHALSAHLETVSRVSITGESYAWASGSAQTLGMGIWYAGISDCPGITQPAMGYLVLGTDEMKGELTNQANKFLDVYRQMVGH